MTALLADHPVACEPFDEIEAMEDAAPQALDEEGDGEMAAEPVVVGVPSVTGQLAPLIFSVSSLSPAARTAERKQVSAAFVLSLVVHGVIVAAICLGLRYGTRPASREYGVVELPSGDGDGGGIGNQVDGPTPVLPMLPTSPQPIPPKTPIEEIPEATVLQASATLPDQPLMMAPENVEQIALAAREATPLPTIKPPDRSTRADATGSPETPTAGTTFSDAPLQQAMSSSAGGSAVTAAQAVSSAGGQSASHLGGFLASQEPLGDQKPILYPAEAKRRGWEGTVIVRVHITPAGDVDQASVVQSSGHSVLDRAAVNGLLERKYRPWIVDGKAVESGGTLPVNFHLE